jgi:DNA-binding transcriptional LysR family regulator
MEWSERIGRRIRLRDLHILLAVAQHKSMAKAAEHLAISKPVISKVIADLEHVLGVRLLERDRHGAEPTIYGAALLKRGVIVFDELREGVKDLEFLASPEAGEVRIGAIPPLAASFVFAVADQLSRRYPRIVFHLVTMETDKLYNELSERNVDLLIARRIEPVADQQQSFEFLFEDPNVIVAGAQNAWARRRKVKLGDLLNEPWVLAPTESPPGSIAMEAFHASGLDCPRTTMFALDPGVRFNLLATGRYLTIFPASALRFPVRRLGFKILPIELPTPRVAIGIVTLKNRTPSPVARLFIDTAREVANTRVKRK